MNPCKLCSSFLALVVFALAASAETLRFSATGCGPYAAAEEPLLEKYVRDVGADGQSEFLVHLGDVVSGSKKKWPESQYEKVAGILKGSRIPVFVVLGDNEYNDLEDPALGLKFWMTHFYRFEKHWPASPKLDYQEARPENFAWAPKGVLMIGLNLPGGRVDNAKEWNQRMNDDADWVRACMKKWKDTRACVVLAQAMPSNNHKLFFNQLAKACADYGKPVLYLHADGHKWEHEPGWMVPNLLRVQTDQVNRAPPVLVSVTEDPKQPFEFDRRLPKK